MPDTTGSSYAQAYAAWNADPEAWWAHAAEGIDWINRWDRGFDPALGAFGQWLPGGTLNMAQNCLDRHVDAGRGAQAALIWDSPMAQRTETFTYASAGAGDGRDRRKIGGQAAIAIGGYGVSGADSRANTE